MRGLVGRLTHLEDKLDLADAAMGRLAGLLIAIGGSEIADGLQVGTDRAYEIFTEAWHRLDAEDKAALAAAYDG